MEELVESILDYIRSDYTDYAVMLNGEWGSGKRMQKSDRSDPDQEV